jgi:hypothetical protein
MQDQVSKVPSAPAERVFHDLIGVFQSLSILLTEVQKTAGVSKGLVDLAAATEMRLGELLPEVRALYQIIPRS